MNSVYNVKVYSIIPGRVTLTRKDDKMFDKFGNVVNETWANTNNWYYQGNLDVYFRSDKCLDLYSDVNIPVVKCISKGKNSDEKIFLGDDASFYFAYLEDDVLNDIKNYQLLTREEVKAILPVDDEDHQAKWIKNYMWLKKISEYAKRTYNGAWIDYCRHQSKTFFKSR